MEDISIIELVKVIFEPWEITSTVGMAVLDSAFVLLVYLVYCQKGEDGEIRDCVMCCCHPFKGCSYFRLTCMITWATLTHQQ